VIRSFFSRQFILFLISGGIAALLNFGSRIIYSFWWGFSTAVILAYITGMVVAFILARIFVFGGGTQTTYRSATLFVLVNLVAVAQTWAISVGLAYYLLPLLGIRLFVPEIAHGVGVIFPVFTSYIGHKHLSFR
jgi:putative flippase GtrA